VQYIYSKIPTPKECERFFRKRKVIFTKMLFRFLGIMMPKNFTSEPFEAKLFS